MDISTENQLNSSADCEKPDLKLDQTDERLENHDDVSMISPNLNNLDQNNEINSDPSLDNQINNDQTKNIINSNLENNHITPNETADVEESAQSICTTDNILEVSEPVSADSDLNKPIEVEERKLNNFLMCNQEVGLCSFSLQPSNSNITPSEPLSTTNVVLETDKEDKVGESTLIDSNLTKPVEVNNQEIGLCSFSLQPSNLNGTPIKTTFNSVEYDAQEIKQQTNPIHYSTEVITTKPVILKDSTSTNKHTLSPRMIGTRVQHAFSSIKKSFKKTKQKIHSRPSSNPPKLTTDLNKDFVLNHQNYLAYSNHNQPREAYSELSISESMTPVSIRI